MFIHRLLKKEYVRLDHAFTKYYTTITRNVNGLKQHLLKWWELKNPDYGEYALTNTDICYTVKDNKVHVL